MELFWKSFSFISAQSSDITPSQAAHTLGQSTVPGASVQPAAAAAGQIALGPQSPVAMEMEDIDTPDVTENLFYNVTGKSNSHLSKRDSSVFTIFCFAVVSIIFFSRLQALVCSQSTKQWGSRSRFSVYYLFF